jgi:hypothetical protein
LKLLLFLSLIFCKLLFAQGYKIDEKTGKAVAKYVGQVVMIRGKVEMFDKDDNPLRLSIGKKIYPGQVIKTHQSSVVRVKTTDQTVLTLAPKTVFKVTDFNPDPSKRKRAVFDLIAGKMRAKVEKRKNNKKYTFRTKTVSMGIRGTEFLMNYKRNKNSVLTTQVALLTGKLEVENLLTNKVQTMNKKQLYLQDSNGEKVLAADMKEMSDEQFAKYSKNVDVFSNDVAPFLDFQDHELSQKGKTTSGKSIKGQKSKDWKKTLHKLNDKLKK